MHTYIYTYNKYIYTFIYTYIHTYITHANSQTYKREEKDIEAHTVR